MKNHKSECIFPPKSVHAPPLFIGITFPTQKIKLQWALFPHFSSLLLWGEDVLLSSCFMEPQKYQWGIFPQREVKNFTYKSVGWLCFKNVGVWSKNGPKWWSDFMLPMFRTTIQPHAQLANAFPLKHKRAGWQDLKPRFGGKLGTPDLGGEIQAQVDKSVRSHLVTLCHNCKPNSPLEPPQERLKREPDTHITVHLS